MTSKCAFHMKILVFAPCIGKIEGDNVRKVQYEVCEIRKIPYVYVFVTLKLII